MPNDSLRSYGSPLMLLILSATCLVGHQTGQLVWGDELYVGAAHTDITPLGKVAVSGQFHLRISQQVETPLTAQVLVLESREGEASIDSVIMASCDVISIPVEVLAMVREEVVRQSPGIPAQKIFLNGTHTHTAPELRAGMWVIPEGVLSAEEYCRFFAKQVATAIVQAWQTRGPGSISWGLTHAVVGYNRRAVYADQTAKMYGATDIGEFRGLEGPEDHDVGSLFAWNAAGQLLAVGINVTCPSQEVESRRTLNADFWHPVREQLRTRFGEDLCVLGWPGAAGDQSPHLMYRKAADERMRQLRGLSRLDEIARRIVRAVEEAYEVVQQDRHANVPIAHRAEQLTLPMRLVKPDEYEEARREVASANAQINQDASAADRVYRRMKWYQATVERFERQQTEPAPTLKMELHVVRIGDTVVCTNPFELFTEYGLRIKARSKAEQTFVIQLVGPGTYLPTQRAVAGGHYSAIVHSSHVGPEGGQVLVDRTVALIDSLWNQ